MMRWRCWSRWPCIVLTEADDHLTVTFAGWDLPGCKRPYPGYSRPPKRFPEAIVGSGVT